MKMRMKAAMKMVAVKWRKALPFRDNAILQREMKLPAWGWSKPGTKITAEFAGQKKSATAYSFAYHVFREIDVPVGILNCSFSQTSIQAWTPRIGYLDGTEEYTKSLWQKMLETDPTTPEHKAAWEKYYTEVEAAVKAGDAVPTKTPGNMGHNGDAARGSGAALIFVDASKH